MIALRTAAAVAFLSLGLFGLYVVVEAPRSGAFAGVFSGAPGGRGVALTFDDGPTPGVTEPLLEALERARVPATFFVVGRAARAHPELLARMRRDGFAVENHSQDHVHLNALGPAALDAQIDGANAAIVAVTGRRPRWIRPPFGARNAALVAAARRRGMRVVTWSASLLDDPVPDVDALAARVRGGDVILLHDGERGTGRRGERAFEATLAPRLIERIRARGLRFVGLDALADGQA